MSIAVPFFYRVHNQDIFDLMPLLNSMRLLYKTMIVEDLSRFVGDEPHGLAMSIKDSTQQGDRSSFNIAGGVVLILKRPNIYLKFFGPPHFLDIIVDYATEIKGVKLEDLSYDGHGDIPDDLSLEEWNRRKGIIESLGMLDTPYDEAGLSYDFANESDAYEIADAIEKRK